MPATPLRRLRRYQNLFLLGGGFVITLIALLTFIIMAVYSMRQLLVDERQQINDDRILVATTVKASEVSLRRTVSYIELSWPTMPVADEASYDAFLQNGNRLVIERPAMSTSIVFAADESALADPGRVRRYLALAQQFAITSAAVSISRNVDAESYIYSPDGKMVIVPESRSSNPPFRSVDSLASALKIDLDALPAGPVERPGGFHLPVFWLPPFNDPLTGDIRLRLAAVARSHGDAFAIVVVEYDPQMLLNTLSSRSENEAYAIVSPDGRILAHLGSDDAKRYAAEAAAAGRLLPGRAFFGSEIGYYDGFFVLREPVVDTGWTLLYAFSWRDVVSGMVNKVGTVAVATAVILCAMWVLLLMFRRRVLAPLLDDSERMFESERLRRTMVQTVPVGLALVSCKDGEWLSRSPQLHEMASRIVGEADVLAASLVARFKDFEMARGGHTADAIFRQDFNFEGRDGGCIELEVSASKARYKGADVLVAAFIDVTERRRLERELERAMRAADSANQAKSAFLAAMSHEIRTPLNAILGNLELFAKSPLSGLQRDRLATVRSASEGLLSVINDVLDFSKIEAGEMTLEHIEFDVVEVIERVIAIFEPVARARGLGFYVRLDMAASQPMFGDPTRVAQILNNLLSNAIKFTENGTVTLDACIDEAADGAYMLRVAVADTGIGISQVHLGQLFRAFSQVDVTINRRFGGTGLGLTLCQHLLRAMGGTIDVESTPAVGSRFTARLPLGEGVTRAQEARMLSGQHVVFLSAEQQWCDLVVPHLQRWGAEVQVIRDPASMGDDELEACSLLMVWGNREQWSSDDENRLVENARWVIDGTPDGPAQVIRMGKVLSVSCLSLKGIEAAVRATLLGEPLPGMQSAATSGSLAELAGKGRSLRVLMAEDNPANRLLLTEQLTLLGCQVKAAPTGQEALDLLGSDDWDLLLTDLNMPGMSGYELADAVHRVRPLLPIIAITAHATKEEQARCKAAGMTQVLIKPLSLQQLSDAMSQFASERGASLNSPSHEAEAKLQALTMQRELREIFVKATADSLLAIDAAQKKNDWNGILAQLHSLRGAFAVCGYAALAADCEQVERAFQSGNAADPNGCLDRFKVSVQDLIDDDIAL